MSLTKATYSMVNGAPVNVLDFNADPTGATDSTIAIQAAINALQADETLFFSTGTYKVTSTLTVGSNKKIDLGDAVLTYTGAIFVFTIGGSNVSIQNGTIEGPDSGAYVSGSGAIKAWGTDNGAATPPTRLTNININNVKVNNVGDAAFEGRYLSNTSVKNCTFTNLGYTGIGFYHSNNCEVKNNYIKTVAGETISGELNAYGVYFSGTDNTDAVRYPPCEDCIASFNEVLNIPTWMAFITKSGKRVGFTYNTVKDCRIGVAITYHGNNQATDCVIAFNTFQNNLPRTNNSNGTNKQWSAIWDIGKSATYPTVRTRIENNDIYQHGAGINVTGAIHIECAKDGVCSNNTLVESWLTGIFVNLNVVNYSITNNTIIDPKSDGTGASPAMSANFANGLRFYDNTFTNIKVANNSFIKRDTSVATYVHTEAIRVADTALKTIDFYGNTFLGFSLASYRFYFAGNLDGLSGDIEYTFTGTLTGCTTSPTGSIISSVKDGVATLHIPAISATSNTTAATITGIPEWLKPAANRFGIIGGVDNSAATVLTYQVDDTANEIKLFPGYDNTGTFTASNTKGIYYSSLTYVVKN